MFIWKCNDCKDDELGLPCVLSVNAEEGAPRPDQPRACPFMGTKKATWTMEKI